MATAPKQHPATLPTPDQLATVRALRARLVSAIANAPAFRRPRAQRLLRQLDAYAKSDRGLLGLYLADWREGIEAECGSLEMARVSRSLAA